MPSSPVIELSLNADSYARLQDEAMRRGTDLTILVQELVEDYLNDLDDDFEDTPEDEILAGFQQGWHEAMTGKTRPADEVLEEIRKARTYE
jgi:predicted DNA-binding protein